MFSNNRPAINSLAECQTSVADSRYEPISLGIGTSFKFLQNHTAIQQRQKVTPQIASNAYIKHPVLENTYLELIPLLEAHGKHLITKVLKSKIYLFRLKKIDRKRYSIYIFWRCQNLEVLDQ